MYSMMSNKGPEDSKRCSPKLPFYLAAAAALLLVLAGCGNSNHKNSAKEDAVDDPTFQESVFTNPTQIDNTYQPFTPGTTHVFLAQTEDGKETIVTAALDEVKEVAGVDCVVVHDRAFVDGLLTEDTLDWYAQDDEGNVWYFGEDSTSYEYDDDDMVLDSSKDGSWEAGVDGAVAGILIKAVPVVGDIYQQEFYEGVAEDMAEVVALNVPLTLEDGSMYTCLKTLEWSPLEEDSEENKYYAAGVGVVKEEEVDGEEFADLRGTFLRNTEDSLPDFAAAVFSDPTTIDNTYLPWTPGTVFTYEAETEDGLETTVVEVLADTVEVAGVTCVVVRDQVFLDDLLIEDTHDWYAQDDDGNVWYLGEDSTSYEYDDDDMLIETNDDGSWEAGVDGALPGIVMWTAPMAGMSYYQEYREGEAEDMGYVVATGVEIESDGSFYEGCVQILDWNPLEPGVLEYKYFAPDVGLVLEEELTDEELVAELVSIE